MAAPLNKRAWENKPCVSIPKPITKDEAGLFKIKGKDKWPLLSYTFTLLTLGFNLDTKIGGCANVEIEGHQLKPKKATCKNSKKLAEITDLNEVTSIQYLCIEDEKCDAHGFWKDNKFYYSFLPHTCGVQAPAP